VCTEDIPQQVTVLYTNLGDHIRIHIVFFWLASSVCLGCPCDCIGTVFLHASCFTLLSRSSLVPQPTASKRAWSPDSGRSLMHQESVVTCVLVVMHVERPLVWRRMFNCFLVGLAS
jgi:hypothetical protein